MVEIVAAFARWLQIAANFVLLGSYVFLIIADSSIGRSTISERPWIEKLQRFFPWMAACVSVGLVIIMACTLVQITGNTGSLWQLDKWSSIVIDTHAGQIWILRVALSILLLVLVLYSHKISRSIWRHASCAMVAALPLIAGTFASHVALEAPTFTTVLPYAIHVVLAGVWLGALPAFLLLVYEKKEFISLKLSEKSELSSVLNNFSSVIFPVMLLIILTGIVVSDHIFDGYYAALVATPYGWLLSSKILLLGVILLIAERVRSKWLPALNQNNQMSVNVASTENLRKWVGIEFLLALILLLLATLLTNSVPVKNLNIEEWPLPFRFSIVATWSLPNVELQAWTGLVIVFVAFGLFLWGRLHQWKVKQLTITVFLILAGAMLALQAITIRAYPETYRKPGESFSAVSIANGANLFSENCVECHGVQGKGNGIKSRTLSTKLPDLLMEPHTIEHTPGDFYHWITYGMENTDMPGYVEKLSNEDRWDLVNFIHALSRGYQSRILSPTVIPGKAFIQPPVFFYGTQDGNSRTLQDFRDDKTVLLVIFSWPLSEARMNQLKTTYNQLVDQNVTVIAVPSNELNDATKEFLSNEFPFDIVVQGSSEIVTSYALSRRTIYYPDIIGRGSDYDHMEFLIDRYGYLRARWIPSIDEKGWNDVDLLNQQLTLLDREELEVSPAKDYVQ
ncbi:putative copper resistance protein D [Nitrosomonas sp. PY1]|uniref:CopD family protein n=1 Tax=Nitrosomonas sp. PY1 TaxID=1803906 RepID=UPI001FC8CCD9|nr:CopD family protein [Nitrosomonas sp. PY1]GKS68674.1 putative copper resistance protein D [Nitrosomonas sp. PY1]